MEDIKRITEETANELADSLEEFLKSAEAFESAFNTKMEVYMKECQRAAASKFLDYMHKYACATFLTRWYWLRKARKCNDALRDIIRFNEESFNQKRIHHKQPVVTNPFFNENKKRSYDRTTAKEGRQSD